MTEKQAIDYMMASLEKAPRDVLQALIIMMWQHMSVEQCAEMVANFETMHGTGSIQ